MTQPVQEPTQGRLDAGQEFRTRQLYRRPGPVVSPLAACWGSGTGSSVGTGNLVIGLPLENFGTNDPATFDTATTPWSPGGGWANANTNRAIRLLQPGLYRVQSVFLNNSASGLAWFRHHSAFWGTLNGAGVPTPISSAFLDPGLQDSTEVPATDTVQQSIPDAGTLLSASTRYVYLSYYTQAPVAQAESFYYSVSIVRLCDYFDVAAV